METGRYYLGRVIKMGFLDQTKLMDAIVQCPPQTIGKFSWAITDVVDRRHSDDLPHVFGKLSKYSAEGAVTIVDTSKKHQVPAVAKNLLVASSPFVYLPQFSGIAYLHVWNEIQEDVFPRRFKALIERVYENFFVECTIEPIADYRAFISKLKEMERITEISAKVNPPNPLFGRLWKRLREYIEARNATEVLVREQNKEGGSLNTQIIELISQIVEEPRMEKRAEPVAVPEPSITDSALLMAADGYGHGKVVGERKEERLIVRTSDSKQSFPFPKVPDHLELAKEAESHLKRVSGERGMEHP